MKITSLKRKSGFSLILTKGVEVKKIKWNLKKTGVTLLGILGIGTLTSCYGMPPNQKASFIEGKIKSGSEKTIPGIEVSLFDKDGLFLSKTISDKDGNYAICIFSLGKYILKFKDIDGIENGKYKTLETSVNVEDVDFSTLIIKNVVLDKAD